MSTDYTVKAGDSLSSIAEHQLGDVSLWPKIAALNHIQSPYVIRVDQVLQLPSAPAMHTIDVPATPVVAPSSAPGTAPASSSMGLLGRALSWTRAHPGLAAIYGLSVAASVVGLWWYLSNPKKTKSTHTRRRRSRAHD